MVDGRISFLKENSGKCLTFASSMVRRFVGGGSLGEASSTECLIGECFEEKSSEMEGVLAIVAVRN